MGDPASSELRLASSVAGPAVAAAVPEPSDSGSSGSPGRRSACSRYRPRIALCALFFAVRVLSCSVRSSFDNKSLENHQQRRSPTSPNAYFREKQALQNEHANGLSEVSVVAGGCVSVADAKEVQTAQHTRSLVPRQVLAPFERGPAVTTEVRALGRPRDQPGQRERKWLRHRCWGVSIAGRVSMAAKWFGIGGGGCRRRWKSGRLRAGTLTLSIGTNPEGETGETGETE